MEEQVVLTEKGIGSPPPPRSLSVTLTSRVSLSDKSAETRHVYFQSLFRHSNTVHTISILTPLENT